MLAPLAARHRFDEAIAAYEAAFKLNPESINAHLGLGRVFERSGDLDQALSCYNRAIAINPNHGKSYWHRGSAYLYALHRATDAIEDFNRAIDLDPDWPLQYTCRGDARFHVKDYRGAIADYDAFLRLERNRIGPRAATFGTRALTYIVLKEYEKAVEDCNARLLLDPESAWAFMTRSFAYEGIGNQEQARQDYEKALELDPDVLVDAKYTGLASFEAIR